MLCPEAAQTTGYAKQPAHATGPSDSRQQNFPAYYSSRLRSAILSPSQSLQESDSAHYLKYQVASAFLGYQSKLATVVICFPVTQDAASFLTCPHGQTERLGWSCLFLRNLNSTRGKCSRPSQFLISVMKPLRRSEPIRGDFHLLLYEPPTSTPCPTFLMVQLTNDRKQKHLQRRRSYISDIYQ